MLSDRRSRQHSCQHMAVVPRRRSLPSSRRVRFRPCPGYRARSKMSRMGSTSVTVVLPLIGRSVETDSTRAAIAKYLESTGFELDVVMVEGDGYGRLLRRGINEARGEVIVVVDPELPYPVSAIGDAVAMIESGATEIVFGTARPVGAGEPGNFLLRSLLVPTLPDPSIHLKAFSASAAKLVFR